MAAGAVDREFFDILTPSETSQSSPRASQSSPRAPPDLPELVKDLPELTQRPAVPLERPGAVPGGGLHRPSGQSAGRVFNNEGLGSLIQIPAFPAFLRLLLEVVAASVPQTLPSTRAGGQDNGSLTNSLKPSAKFWVLPLPLPMQISLHSSNNGRLWKTR